MPSPKECNKIKDPAERKKCLAYKGKYASPVKGSLKKSAGGGGGY